MKKENGKQRAGKRTFSAEQKLEALDTHFRKAKMVETCEELRIHPNLLGMWWKTTMEAAAPALAGEKRRKDRTQQRAIERLESELERKNQVIAELAAEVLGLKKHSGEI